MRMMSLLRHGRKLDLYCHSSYITKEPNRTSATIFVTEALFYGICDNHNKDYGGWIISREAPSYFADSSRYPYEVVVSNAMIDMNSANS